MFKSAACFDGMRGLFAWEAVVGLVRNTQADAEHGTPMILGCGLHDGDFSLDGVSPAIHITAPAQGNALGLWRSWERA